MSDRRSPQQTPVTYPLAFQRGDMGPNFLGIFDQKIKQHGYRIERQPVVLCPCVRGMADGGQGTPDLDCPSCRGVGRFWDVAQSVEERVLITSIRASKAFRQQTGEHATDRLSCTFQSGSVPTHFDRVKMLDVIVPIVEPHERVAGGSNSIVLRFDAVAVSLVYIRDPATRVVTKLTPTTHYTFTAATSTLTIVDAAGTFPGQTVRLTVRYSAYPWFLVTEIPNQYRGVFTKLGIPEERWHQLPILTMLTRGDLVGDLQP